MPLLDTSLDGLYTQHNLPLVEILRSFDASTQYM